MRSNTGRSTQRGIAFVIVMGLLLSMVPQITPVFAGINDPVSDVFDPNTGKLHDGWKVSVPQNNQFDYIGDQQTGVGQNVSQDIVGNQSSPAFYTKFNSSTNKLSFRFRLNAQDGKASQIDKYAFKKFAFIGVDQAIDGQFDGKLDFFIGIYNVNNFDSRGRIGIYKVDPTKANNSPATTGIINPPVLVKTPIPAFNINGVNYQSLKTGGNFWIDKADTSFTINSTAHQDYFLSFQLSLDDINTAMRLMNKPSITSSSGMRYMIGTASQDNSFNQDLAGINGINTRSTTTWADLGVYTPTTSLTTLNGGTSYQVNFCENASATSIVTSMSAVPGFGLGYLPTLPNVTGSGSYFVGWSTSTTSGIADFTKDTVINRNTTVYGIWTSNNCTLNFYDNPPVSNATSSRVAQVTVASGGSLGSAMPTANYPGSTFLGWKTTSSATEWLSPSTPISQSSDYYAIWASTYIVTFVINTNNGSAFLTGYNDSGTEITTTNNVTVAALGGVELGALPETIPASNTYLKGWTTSNSGIGTIYTEKTIIDSSVTLYATWTSIGCTVKFDLNGVAGTAPSDMTVASGAAIGQLPSADGGATPFDGWFTAASGGDRVTADTIIAKDQTLFAHWAVLSTLTFKNGASTYVTRTGIVGHQLEDLPPPPTSASMQFKGWTRTSGGSDFISTSTSITGDMIFFASWSAIQYLITYDYGYATTPAITSTEVGYGATLGESLPQPTRDHYRFEGWYTGAGGTGQLFTSTTAVTTSATIYASWSAIQYGVTFYDNLNQSIVSSTSLTFDSQLGSLPSTTKTGYRFDGWSKTSGGIVDVNDHTTISGITTFYAVWTPDVYNVTFNLDDTILTGSGFYGTSIGALSGTTIGGAEAIARADKPGHTFQGWTTDPAANTTDASITEATTITGITTYYAVYQHEIYTITFDYGDQTNKLNNLTGTGIYGTSLGALSGTSIEAASAAAIVEGYRLTVWKDQSGQIVNSSTTISGIATYYAVWTTVYAIKFVTNGGIDSPYATGSAVSGSAISPWPGDPNNPGYSFTGWYTSPGGAHITSGSIVTSNMDLEASWSAIEYTINYELNGGTNSASNPRVYTIESQTIVLEHPTKAGHTFSDWYDSAMNGNQVTQITSGSIGTITLYAIWTVKNYTVNFTTDGGTTVFATNSTAYNTSLGGLMPTNPTLAGYTFDGWSTNSASNAVNFTSSTAVTENITVYAIWTLQSYTVTFDLDGTILTGSGFYGTSIGALTGTTIGGAQARAQKTGHTFQGWTTDPAANTPDVSITGTTTITGITTYYAVYQHDIYTITFDYGDKRTNLTGTGIHGTNLGALSGTAMEAASAAAVVQGYLLTGWKDQTNQIVNSSTTISSIATYYAVWTTIHAITFVTDGGVSSPFATRSAVDGNTITTWPTDPSKTGYHFTGWYTSPGGMEVTSGSSVTGSGTYYASWSAMSYTISLDPNHGNHAATTFAALYDSTLGDRLTNPSDRTGYNFAGWYANTSGTGSPITSAASITGNAIYYAHWTAKNYIVNFNGNGGTVSVPTMGAAYNTSLGSLQVPSRAGYTFEGWFKGTGGTGDEFTSNEAIGDDNLTVYASWSALHYHVTFHYNYGSPESTTTRSVTYNETLGSGFPSISRANYHLVGWFDHNDGTGTPFTSSSAVTTDKAVYASWSAISGTVEGIVTEKEQGGIVKVSGASVKVYKDNVLIGSYTTGSDGKYSIAVPQIGVDYDIRITKQVKVGNDKTKDITFIQKNESSETNDANLVSKSKQTLTGVVLEKTTGGGTDFVTQNLVTKFKIDLKTSGSSVDVATNVSITTDGVFNIEGLNPGQTYQMLLKYPFSDARELVVGKSTVTITTAGEINIVQALIDPYGTITDANTGAVISGAEVTLIYASGVSAGAVVSLPAVTDFPPANNDNPQNSDSNGQYAFMVFPNTDYYVLAKKTGYLDYKSPLIQVLEEIVKHDFKMTPVAISSPSAPTGGGSGNGTAVVDGKQRDLAIALLADKMKLLEDKSGKFTVYAVNKSDDAMPDVYVKVTIPAGYGLLDFTPGGSRNGQDIVWNLGTLDPNTVKTYTLNLKSGKLDQAKLLTEFTAKIGTNLNIALANPEDDLSLLKIMQFSNRYQLSDKPYVTGYPDGNVKPLGQVTRAEVAAMFTRLLQLTKDPNKTTRFADVPDTEWYANYMEIMAEQGIFKGYEDGTIHPNQSITRAELGIAIARLLGISRENFGGELYRLSSFQDTNKHWADATIEELYRFKVVSGNGFSFRPDDTITREESMKMINRLFYRGPLNGADPSFPDNKKGYWSFGEIEEAARDHSYQVNEDGSEQLIH